MTRPAPDDPASARGPGLGELLPSLWLLGLFFLATATLAITRFRRKRLA